MPAARIALWVAIVGSIAVLLRSVLLGPIPLWLAVTLLVCFTALTTLGWVLPGLQMYGDVVTRGPAQARGVALTFDDGPHPDTTRQVLAMLARGGHRATFFLVGRKVVSHPEVVRQIHEAGHSIGLHSFSHERLYSCKPPHQVVADIRATQRAIEDACGVRPTLFRPPIGHVSPRTAAGAKRANVTLVAWSVRGLDGLASSPDRVLRRVLRGLTPGAIVALHDAAERDDFEPAALAALPAILTEIENRGLQTVGVEEFIDPAAG